MRLTIFTTVLLAGLYSVTGAFADDPVPNLPPVEVPAPAAPAAPAKYYLELEPADLQAISQALNELPKRVADPLILRLNAQIQNQVKIIENKDAAEKPKKGKK